LSRKFCKKFFFCKLLEIYAKPVKPSGWPDREGFINFHVKVNERQPNPPQVMHKLIAAYCYDPTLITKPKTFHIQDISTLFDLKTLCLSRRLFQSLAPKIILPTKPLGGY
jgi:hypothetical protein